VVNIAAFAWDGAATDSNATDCRLIMHGPGNLVNAMNSLFDNAVTTELDKVVPIAELPFRVTNAGRPGACGRHRFNGAGVISCVVGHQLPDRAIENLLEGVLDHVVVSPAKAGNQRQIFGFRLLGRVEHRANPECIGGYWLFTKYVLVCFYARGQVLGAKARGSG